MSYALTKITLEKLLLSDVAKPMGNFSVLRQTSILVTIYSRIVPSLVKTILERSQLCAVDVNALLFHYCHSDSSLMVLSGDITNPLS